MAKSIREQLKELKNSPGGITMSEYQRIKNRKKKRTPWWAK